MEFAMQRLALPFTFCVLWFMVAWAIDRFWFTVVCAQCSALFAFEFSLKARDLLSVSTERVSAIFLFVVPFVAYAFALLPYRRWRQPAAWSEAAHRWARPFFWLTLVFMWVWLIESAYGMLAGVLPAWFKNYAESYQLNLSGTVLGLREITVHGKLGGLFGLALGGYLFLARGLSRR
jgi:hypothetical protein